MPGRLFLERPTAEVAAILSAECALEEPPRRNIAPGQEILVYQDGRLDLQRWGLLPAGRVNARGRPVMDVIVNARSETVFQKSAFEGVKRAVVPADGWYEWTGKARRKTAWRIAPKDDGLLFFAAITDTWSGPGGIQVNQVATVTTEPNADLCDIHHRMGALLKPDEIEQWMTAYPKEAMALLHPYPNGLLKVEKAQNVDWNAP